MTWHIYAAVPLMVGSVCVQLSAILLGGWFGWHPIGTAMAFVGAAIAWRGYRLARRARLSAQAIYRQALREHELAQARLSEWQVGDRCEECGISGGHRGTCSRSMMRGG